ILAQQGYRPIFIEENPEAVAQAELNYKRLTGLPEAVFFAGRVENLLSEIPAAASRPEWLVVNPSRKGLEPATRQFLSRMSAEGHIPKMIYVSCDVGTLSRDLADLGRAGYQLRQLESFDMFPHTSKLE